MKDVSYENGQLVEGGKRADFGTVLNAIGRGSVEATEIRVKRVITLMDIGTVVNPKTAQSQMIGGIVFGIGIALLEGSHLEETTACYANANFADYLVATNADVPYIDVHLIGKPDTIFNSVGARGPAKSV